LRHHIIAICSLYIVMEKNSQGKNAHAVEHFGDASRRRWLVLWPKLFRGMSADDENEC